MVKNPLAMQETWGQCLGWEDAVKRVWQPTPVICPENPTDRGGWATAHSVAGVRRGRVTEREQIKATCEKSTVNIMLSESPLKSGISQGYPLLPLIFNTVHLSLSRLRTQLPGPPLYGYLAAQVPYIKDRVIVYNLHTFFHIFLSFLD